MRAVATNWSRHPSKQEIQLLTNLTTFVPWLNMDDTCSLPKYTSHDLDERLAFSDKLDLGHSEYSFSAPPILNKKPFSIKYHCNGEESDSDTLRNGSSKDVNDERENDAADEMMENYEASTLQCDTVQSSGCSMFDDLTVPSQSVASFFRPQEMQVNYFETNTHPEIIHGIPWARMHEERYRLVTFRRFPSHSPISTLRLASKGFVYIDSVTGHSIIICFFCNTQLKINNENVDNIDEEHRRLAAGCPMLNGAHCSNTPLSHQCATQNTGDSLPHTVTGGYDSQSDEPTSQYSDERTSSHDEVDHGGLPRNNDHNYSNQTSQLMSDSFSTPQHDLTMTSQTISNGAQVDSATTPTNNSSAHNGPETNNSGLPQSTNQQEQTDLPQETTSDNAGVTPSFEHLGIITARAKHTQHATKEARFETFVNWPREHHIQAGELVEAGFFYQGRGDCVRCFYCGMGLRNWEKGDNAWVEHARWSPKCAFLWQVVGRDFVDTVQHLIKETEQQISYGVVVLKMEESGRPVPFDIGKSDIARDPAVMALTSHGFDKNQILDVAKEMLEEGESLSSGTLYEAAIERNIPKSDDGTDSYIDSTSGARREDNEGLKELAEKICLENHENQKLTKCKVCMVKEVEIVFLPCGHFVTCTECAGALSRCPVCRYAIKGIVRAFMG